MTDVNDTLTRVGTKDRQTYIGGSDVAAILGLSAWPDGTPLMTYFRKKGIMPRDLPPEPDARKMKILRRGKRFEPIIIDMLMEEHPIKVTRRSTEEDPNRYQDGEHPFLAAEVDFEWEVTREAVDHLAEFGVMVDPALIGTIQNGEVKSHHPFVIARKYGELGTDEIPVEYGCQAYHGQGITGRQLTLFAVLAGTDDLRLYAIPRNDENVQDIRRLVVKFWNDHVLADVSPAPINYTDIVASFQRRPDSVVTADANTERLVREWLDAKAELKKFEGQVDELKFVICSYMVGYQEQKSPKAKPKFDGRHELRDADGGLLLSVQQQIQVRVDAARLRAEEPEMADRFAKESKFYTIKRKGERS